MKSSPSPKSLEYEGRTNARFFQFRPKRGNAKVRLWIGGPRSTATPPS